MKNYASSNGIIIEIKNNFEKLRKINIFDKAMITTLCAKVEYDYAKQLKLIIEDINDFYIEIIENILYSEVPVKKNKI